MDIEKIAKEIVNKQLNHDLSRCYMCVYKKECHGTDSRGMCLHFVNERGGL